MTTNKVEKESGKDGWEDAPQASASRQFEPVQSSFVKMTTVGQSIEGILTAKGTEQFPAKEGPPQIVGKYTLQNPDTDQLTTILGATDLDEKMQRIAVGEYVKITLAPPVRSNSNRIVKQYTVERAV